MRWSPTLLAAALAAACTPRGPAPAPSPSPSPRPAGNGLNVLLVTIDTLRADHLGAYGYARATSPHMDALAAEAGLFTRAFTYWPKTRGSFVMMHTGRVPCRNGYSRTHPILAEFNPTLAETLQRAGYRTTALVDNANVAAQYGYARGFARYRETWEEKALPTEMDRTRAITSEAVSILASSARAGEPFFLWLHYVNPHTPYQPPPPHDTAFLDAKASRGPRLPVVEGLHGGIPRQWAVPGQDRLGWYVAQYDGEIAAVDAEVGKVLRALDAHALREKTVVLLTSDHGESLGEHDYYFDHGEDIFDPSMAVPLLLRVPGQAAARSDALASTLDVVPTLLDAVKVSYPPDLAGQSLLPALRGQPLVGRARLFGQNERGVSATWDERHKLVSTPGEDGPRLALYDRQRDPAEVKDLSRAEPEAFRLARRELETFLERCERDLAHTRRLLAPPSEMKMSGAACEQMKALGYVQNCS